MKKTYGITIVTPSYNCKKLTLRLLSSIQKLNYPKSKIEIIVVDNRSTDGTIEEIKRKYKDVKLIDAGLENVSWGGSCNLGFSKAKEDNDILMIDSDVVVDKNMIALLIKCAYSQKSIGIVTPMILYLEDHNWVNQAGANVDLVTGKVGIGWGPKENFLEDKEVQNSGTVLFIKREVIRKIGGIDNWFVAFSDADFCLRAKRAGYKTWYTHEAIAFHDQSKNPYIYRPRLLKRTKLVARNRVLFMRRHGKSLLLFSLFLPLFILYYTKEAIVFRQPRKIFEFIYGTILGFFFPMQSSNYIPLDIKQIP